jgi:hypothetical protein
MGVLAAGVAACIRAYRISALKSSGLPGADLTAHQYRVSYLHPGIDDVDSNSGPFEAP